MKKRVEYSTKDIADIMDMTPMGIIYLEKQGAISPKRKENGYRSYQGDDITVLGMVRLYERIGFSLKESLELKEMNRLDALSILEKKREEIAKQLEMIDYHINQLSIKTPIGYYEIIENINFLWFPVWEDFIDEIDKKDIKMLKETDIAWLKKMPYMSYCGKYDIKNNTYSKGNMIFKDHAKDIVTNKYVETIHLEKCIKLMYRFKNMDTLKKELDNFCEAENINKGNMIYIQVISYNKEVLDCNVFIPIND